MSGTEKEAAPLPVRLERRVMQCNLTKAQKLALNEMLNGSASGTEMFSGAPKGRRLKMLRELGYRGLCEPLWMAERYWRITKRGEEVLHNIKISGGR